MVAKGAWTDYVDNKRVGCIVNMESSKSNGACFLSLIYAAISEGAPVSHTDLPYTDLPYVI